MAKPKMQDQKPRIAILGHRGIPNSYGGFETLAEEISDRLVGFGSKVAVYCRQNYFASQPPKYKGADLVYLPSIRNKFLDTPAHSFLSVLHVIFKNTADVVIMVNVGNAPFALLAKLFGKKVVFCVDGLDWQRKKWNRFARWYLRTCSHFAKFASNTIVTDAQSVQDYYKQARGVDSVLIPYGTDIETKPDPDVDALKEYGLEYKKYFTFAARFEPEYNPLMVIKAYIASGSTLPLVMIGDNKYNPAFVASLKAVANDKVKFLGFVFGMRYKQLIKNSLAYVRAAEVGGHSPAVIESMGRATCIIANDKPENREPLGETGLFYSITKPEELSYHFKDLTEHPEKGIELGKKSAQRAMVLYSWDTIAYEYFKVIKKVAERKHALADTIASTKVSAGKKRILITGAGGMLGSAMREYYADSYVVLATSAHPNEPWMITLDVRDQIAYERAVAEFRPDYIFHLPAMTNLEQCEKSLPAAYAINTLSVKYAAQAATKYGAKLVYISSSNVFDGSKKYYTDNEEPNPINVYGLTKQMGALMAEYYARDYLTIRLGWLMGGGPTKDKKFVAKIIEQIVAGKKELHALVDKAGSVSYARDVAKNLEILLQKNVTGTYNMVCSGMPTRYEVAQEIVRLLNYKDVMVNPVDSSFFAQTFTTARSASECLINERLANEHLNLQRAWQDALADYLKTDYAYAMSDRTNVVRITKTVAA